MSQKTRKNRRPIESHQLSEDLPAIRMTTTMISPEVVVQKTPRGSRDGAAGRAVHGASDIPEDGNAQPNQVGRRVRRNGIVQPAGRESRCSSPLAQLCEAFHS